MNIFKNTTVVVTGASSGIGRALAKNLANKGATVVAAARNIQKLEELVDECPSGSILPFVCDVTNEQNCIDLIDFANRQHNPMKVLINNAGISMRAVFADLDTDVIKRVMDVNFWGAVYCSRAAMKTLLKNKGSIVGISSLAGYLGLPGRTGYSASKFALQGFLEVVRSENRKHGLHVLTACPTFTASNIRKTALDKDGNVQAESSRDEAKLMTAEEVARQVIKAIERRQDELIIGFKGKFAIWFKKRFPKMAEKLTYREIASEPGSPFK